jgi:hypothetical protein
MKFSIRNLSILAILLLSVPLLTACSPEVGSPAWCKKMEETPKGDWTTNQAADYAKHCLFK